MLPNRLLKGCGALSLSLSLLAGCASPVTPPPTETTPVVVAENPPAAQPAAPAAPAAVAPTTLDGKVIFKGQPVAGYAVTVYDARTNLPVERKADLAGATGLAVLDQNLITDGQGGFKLQVVGLAPGQALRVVATKGKTSLEAIVTSDLQTLGAKQRRVLATDVSLTLSELTTAMAKIARNVVLTTQVLTPEAAAPVLAKLMADLEALSTKLDEQLKQMPAMADELVQAESTDAIGKAEASALNVLINNAGLLKETTKVVAELVAEIAKQSKDSASRSTAAADPKLVEALAKVEYVGTVLTGALNGTDGTFNLFNGVTGGQVDASTGIGTIADRVTPNRRSDKVVSNITYVTDDATLRAALADSSVTNIAFANDIELETPLDIGGRPSVTIDGRGFELSYTSIMVPVTITSDVIVKNLTTSTLFSVSTGTFTAGATFDNVTFAGGVTGGSMNMTFGSKAVVRNCTFDNCMPFALFVIGGTLTIEDSHFIGDPNNIALSSGIFVMNVDAAPTITGCTFTNLYVGINFAPASLDTTLANNIQNNIFVVPSGNSTSIGIFCTPIFETTLTGLNTNFTGYQNQFQHIGSGVG